MSVAFRRESDDEHKEPKFEIPIALGPNLVTARGLDLTKARVAEFEALAATETDEVGLEDAQRRLRYWRTRLATAEVQLVPDGSEVAFGTRVLFRLKGKERGVEIVGDDEADPATGSISFSSPLARALMDAQAGETVDFNGEEDAIEVLHIEALN